ncbi:MAG: FlgD immunoglobulin-like domain containing protein, partial [candidate division WOR-3 bacterium]
ERSEMVDGRVIYQTENRDEFLFDTNIFYIPTPNYQGLASVAFGGTNYLVVWEDYRNGSSPMIYGARVAQDGTVLDNAGIFISPGTPGAQRPSVAFDGTNYLVVWQDSRSGSTDIYGARVTTSGVLLDTLGIPISVLLGRQEDASVAFDGTNYLVVWSDDRDSPWPDIYGARVTTDGVVLDPQGIPISTATEWQALPSVSFGGTNYLVVWDDCRNENDWNIYGARVTTDGVVLDPQGIPISTAVQLQHSTSVAFDGTNYLVVWEDERSGTYSDIYGARVSQNGTVLDPQGIPISTASNYEWNPSVVFNGTNYLVVWQEMHSSSFWDLYGARVTTSGVVLEPQGIPISTVSKDQVIPSVAFDGTNHLVVWMDERISSAPNWDIYGARVNQNGTVLDPQGILISIAVNYQWNPSIAFDGTNYLVVWEDSRSGSSIDLYGARVTTGGVVLDPAAMPISTAVYDQALPSVVFGGTNYLVVWEDYRNGPYADLYGARVTTGGVVLDPAGIPISTAVYHQSSPSVAFDGTNYLVVWEDMRSGFPSIYGARVATNGTVLDPTGIFIATDTLPVCDLDYPSVAFDGTNYLVIWQKLHNLAPVRFDIYGARVTTNGTLLDSSWLPISVNPICSECFSSVAFDGVNYLVVWADDRGGYFDIYGARVATDGTVLDPSGIPISTAYYTQNFPSIAFDGVNYLVVWEDDRNLGIPDIYGALVSPSGVVIDSFSLSTQLNYRYRPAVAHGAGNQFLTTYAGFIDYINSHPANTMRIWGNLYQYIGVREDFAISNSEFLLFKIEPNPFHSSARIRYGIKSSSDVSLKVYNIAGQCVRNLVNAKQSAGMYEFNWDGKDDNNQWVSNGVYFCRIEAGNYISVKKMILMR